MVRQFLPLNGLRAFEASARHLSFTRAAIELCVTQAAVSQQVKSLEKRLGVALFQRLPRLENYRRRRSSFADLDQFLRSNGGHAGQD